MTATELNDYLLIIGIMLIIVIISIKSHGKRN
jgi:hypothetical protein